LKLNLTTKSALKFRWSYKSGSSFAGDDFLEDLEKLWLGNFTIAVLVYCADELVTLLLAHLSVLSHMLEGVVDQFSDFINFESSAFVGIVMIKDSVDSIPEVVVCIAHF
jgi:hypothetical protein